MTWPATRDRVPVQWARRQTANRAWLLAAPLLGALIGAAFGVLCIFLRAEGSPTWAALGDAGWPWALLLGAAALATRSAWANVLTVLATGLLGLAAYYVLKAGLALGYPSGAYRGFDVYFQQANVLRWSAAVVAAAVPAGLAGAWIRRLRC
ncbi:hypothetical protein VUN82_01890 [Micrococcaceae bacterium Sec5.1]